MVIAVLTGLVFALLLDGIHNPITDPFLHWQDTVFHQVLPLVMVADLVIVPLDRRVGREAFVLFALYPLGYLLYSLGRGETTGWYPDRFMDPDTIGRYAPVSGWAGVALTNGLLLTGVMLLTAVMPLVPFHWLATMPRKRCEHRGGRMDEGPFGSVASPWHHDRSNVPWSPQRRRNSGLESWAQEGLPPSTRVAGPRIPKVPRSWRSPTSTRRAPSR